MDDIIRIENFYRDRLKSEKRRRLSEGPGRRNENVECPIVVDASRKGIGWRPKFPGAKRLEGLSRKAEYADAKSS